MGGTFCQAINQYRHAEELWDHESENNKHCIAVSCCRYCLHSCKFTSCKNSNVTALLQFLIFVMNEATSDSSISLHVRGSHQFQ